MKYSQTLFMLICIFVGCKENAISTEQTVTRYFKAFHEGDYETIKTVINDSITLIAGDYTMPFDHKSFYEHFKWDSVFKPTYKILDLEKKDYEHIIVTISSSSRRYKFLKNNPLISKFDISLSDSKISKILDLGGVGTDWNVWIKERDSLENWIKIHHPKLDGFLYDMSVKGGLDYLKAIELYEAN